MGLFNSFFELDKQDNGSDKSQAPYNGFTGEFYHDKNSGKKGPGDIGGFGPKRHDSDSFRGPDRFVEPGHFNNSNKKDN